MRIRLNVQLSGGYSATVSRRDPAASGAHGRRSCMGARSVLVFSYGVNPKCQTSING